MVRGTRLHRRIVVTDLVAVLLAGCGAPITVRRVSPPSMEHQLARVPVLDATWERLPASPLGARGHGPSHSADGRVYVLPGIAYEPDSWKNPCDAFGQAGVRFAAVDVGSLACSAETPQATPVNGAAVFDVATGAWRTSPGADVSVYGGVDGDEATIAGRGFMYDIATDTTTDIPFEDVLVYDEPMWTGTELVQIGWDYREGEYQGVGQVTAAAYDPGQGRWRTNPWPLHPPGWESIVSVWTGEDVIAFVDAADPACTEAGATKQTDCTIAAAWQPSSGTWDIRGTTARLGAPVWDGTRILGIRGEHVVAMDPDTLDAVRIAPLPSEVVHREPVWTGEALVFFDRAHPRSGVWVDVAAGTVHRIPPPPDAEGLPTHGAVVEPVAGGLLIWGGAADFEAPSRNSDDGWLLRVR